MKMASMVEPFSWRIGITCHKLCPLFLSHSWENATCSVGKKRNWTLFDKCKRNFFKKKIERKLFKTSIHDISLSSYGCHYPSFMVSSFPFKLNWFMWILGIYKESLVWSRSLEWLLSMSFSFNTPMAWLQLYIMWVHGRYSVIINRTQE